jgi:cystathionine beta-lyase/cystathionine gamma-synthase
MRVESGVRGRSTVGRHGVTSGAEVAGPALRAVQRGRRGRRIEQAVRARSGAQDSSGVRASLLGSGVAARPGRRCWARVSLLGPGVAARPGCWGAAAFADEDAAAGRSPRSTGAFARRGMTGVKGASRAHATLRARMMTPERSHRAPTLCVHAGDTVDPATGAMNVPIHPSSTYALPRVGESLGHVYSRASNPTRDALERCVAELEGGIRALAFASGMAAIACVMELLRPGDHLVAARDLYGGSFRIFETVRRPGCGIEVSYVDVTDVAAVADAIRPTTRMLWLESLANPLLYVPDVPVLAALAHEREILVVVDNTFPTPLGQRPLSLGADVVVHSGTKYLGGHSDTLSGLLVVARPDLAGELARLRNSTGGVLGAFDSYLLLRGIKTLALRLERHAENALAVARFCERDARIARTWHPGLLSHPSHRVAKRLLASTAGVVSVELCVDPALGPRASAHRFMNRLELFAIAEGLAGVESMVGHPATMSHSGMSSEHRESIGISENLVRLSVGIEHIDDLLADLDRALASG